MSSLGLMQRAVLFALLFTAEFARAATNKPFGEYYPHTRWIDTKTHHVTIDAFPDRLAIHRTGIKPIVISGCWRGRAFLRDCRFDYFGVAHEGDDADITGDPRFGDLSFRRVRPDPKT